MEKGYIGSEKLKNKIAIITGGDSGIGRSIAIYFAREGADISLIYLESDDDAEETKTLIEKEGRSCILFRGDLRKESFSKTIINKTLNLFGKIDILVNNAGTHRKKKASKKFPTNNFKKLLKPMFILISI